MNDLHTAAAYQAMDRSASSALGECVPERDLRSIMARISQATEQTCKLCERIHEIAHRVKGPIPSPDEKCGLASGGGGDIGEIHTRLDALFNILQSSSEGISRLESL